MAKRAPRPPRAHATRGTAPGAAQSTAAANHLTAAIAGAGDTHAKTALLKQTHPLYAQRAPGWRILLDAFEGSGGFATGEYIWQYANEKDDEYTERQGMARYHNYAKSLINIYVRHVYREGVTRKTSNQDLEAWWQNVDGARTPIDDFMKRGARLALATGHTGCLVDKSTDAPTGPSVADDKGAIIASLFPAPAILDWRTQHGELTGVKLLEGAAPAAITEAVPTGDDASQYLLWDKQGWARFDHEGEVVVASTEQGALGIVPLSIIRPEPSAEHPFVGQSLLGDPNVYRALFNRCSEQDEVARDQAFSMLVVSVKADGAEGEAAVSRAKKQLGKDIGTTRAVVVQGEASYVTADMGVLEAVGKLIEFLVREIYRAAHVRFERDSLDAESAEAVRLQHTELNEMIANLAADLQRVEKDLARFWFYWRFPSAGADAAFEAANVEIAYSREFFIADLLQELEKWAKAIAMDMGLEFEHYAKKKVVDQLAIDAPLELRQKMHGEIETQVSARETALEDAKARMTDAVTRFGKKPPAAAAA